ncbi:MAG TPA: tandem-95 repeat protein [Acidimicrobiales bacterium]|nr:tandem-95 repeat protein [Acidimicrobiales bacterium]
MLGAGPAQAALSATVTVTPTVDYLGDPGRNFTFTVTNNGTVPVTDVQILNSASSVMPIVGCPTPPAGWTATFTSTQCRFLVPAGPNAIAPAQSKNFVVRVTTAAGTQDQMGTFSVLLNQATYATPYSLNVKIHAWEITDVGFVPAAVPVNSPCPTIVKTAPKNVPGRLVVCGINHTTATATPGTATLAGTLIVAPPGTWTSGPVTVGATPRVLGNWANVNLTTAPGQQTVIATVSSAYYATSPATTFGGFTTNQPPVAVNDGPYVLNEDGSFVLADPGIKANDSDPDGDPITVKLPVETLPAHGTLSQNAAGGFTYTPAANYNGSDSYTYKVTDGQSDSNAATVSFTINPIQDAPTGVGLSPSTVAENQPVNTTVGTLSTTDVDLPGDSHTYTLVAGSGDTGNGAFTISGNQLKTNTVFNFEGQSSFSIRVRSTDSGSNFFEGPLTVTITNVNEVPTNITLDNGSVAENQPVGTLVGTLVTADPDAGDTFTYTMAAGVNDTDNASFQIVGNQLKTNAVFDFETQNTFSIRVRVTDAGGLFREETGTIQVTNANEAPTNLALAPSSVAENQPVATSVGTLSTTDQDAGDTFTYTLVTGVGDADNPSFQISGNQLQTNNVFDFETDNSYTVRVRTTDAGGLFFEKQLTITITNVNEVPTGVGLSPSTVNENQPVNTTVGSLSSTDVDAPDSHTYTLVVGPGDTGNGSFTISGNTLKTNAVFNFEAQSSYSVRIRTTDAGGLFFEGPVTISIGDINDPPVANPDTYGVSGGSVTVAAPGVLGNDTDQDAGATRTAVLDTGPANATTFTLNADGSFSYTTAQTTGSDTFTYHAVDNAGASSAVVLVTLNLNIPPVAVNDTTPATPEDTFIDFDVSANDTDADGPNSALTAVNIGGQTNGTAVLQPGNRIVRFTPAADFSGGASFTYQAFDGSSTSTNTATVSITVTAVNDAPVLADIECCALGYSEQAAATQVTNTITVADVDDTNIESGLVDIVGFESGDELVFVNQNGISGSYATGTGILTLTGTASKANYETALRSITFRNLTNDNPSTSRSIRFKINDGSLDSGVISRAITITPVNDAPVLSTIEGTPLGYNEQAAATQVTNSLGVFDIDDTNLESAVVDISAGFSAGDELLFADQNGITGSYATGTGILTLTGTSSKANYQTALRSITFRNLIDDNPTGTRSIRFKVNDGDADSNTQIRNVSVQAVNDAPTLAAIEGSSQIYSEQAAGVQITNTITVTDPDDTNIESADVRISTGFNTGDELVYVNQNGISGSYATGTGILTMTGTSSVANYQAALRSILFRNLTNDDPTNPVAARTVSFKVNDGTVDSNTQSRTVTVSGVNDRPVVTLDAGTVGYTENAPGVAISPGLTLADPDNANLTFAQVDMSAGGFVLGQDTISFTGSLPPGVTFSGVHPSGVAQWLGSATKAQYEALLRTVTYANTADTFTSTTRTAVFRVGDGTTNSVDKSRGIVITPVDDNPALAGIEGTNLAYTEGDPATVISPAITANDVDSSTLTGATVAITSGFSSAQDSLVFVNLPPISGSYATGTGILTLTGTDSVANYQAALRTIKYQNVSDNPSASKTVSFTVSNALTSNTVSRTIAITAVNDPPVNTVPSTPQTGTEDVAKAIPMSVADPDASSLKVTLTAANGTMTMTTLTGLSFISGDGTNDGLMVFTGTASQVNAALATLSYLGNANYNVAFAGDSSVTLLSDDQGATGTGGTLTDSDSVRIDLDAVNDAPVAVVKSVTVQANMALNDIPNMLVGVTDPDSGDPGYVAGFTFNAPAVNDCTGCTISDIQQTSNGSFDLDPGPGLTGAKTLAYTVTDNGSPVGPPAASAPTAINLTINGPVIWFVDGTVAGPGDGRMSSPFKNLSGLAGASNDADDVDASGHRIFVKTGTVPTGGINLNSNEWLIGQGATGSFDTFFAITPPSNTLARPSLSGTRPTIQGNVDMDTSDKVQGLNVTTTGTTQGLSATSATSLTVSEASLNTATGIALNLVNSDGTFSLTAVSANGAANGIVWTNTAQATGSLEVTGDSGSANNGSGGVINNTSGAGVSLTNSRSVSLDQMNITNANRAGVDGTGAIDFAFTNGTISGAGDSKVDVKDASIALNDTPGGVKRNVSGAVTVTGSSLTGAYGGGVDIDQTDGTISDLTISNNTLSSSTSTADSKGNAILVNPIGVASTVSNVTKGSISNNTITNFPSGTAIQFTMGNTGGAAAPSGTYGTPGSATNKITISGNLINGGTNKLNGYAILASPAGKAQANFAITNNGTAANPLTNFKAEGIAVGGGGSVTADFLVSGNVITANNINNSPGIGVGVGPWIVGGPATLSNPLINTTIINNTINSPTQGGINAIMSDSNGTWNAKITGNIVAGPTGSQAGISIDQAQPVGGFTGNTVCVQIGGATAAEKNNAGAGGDDGFGNKRPGIVLLKANALAGPPYKFGLVGLSPSPATAAQTQTFLVSQNGTLGTGAGFFAGLTAYVSDPNFTSCTLPTMP